MFKLDEKLKLNILIIFTIGYTLIFTILAIVKKNYEFLYYTLIISFFIFIIAIYRRRMNLSLTIMVSLSIIGIMHILGGYVYIYEIRLYELWIIPHILRYDNLVHFAGSFVGTFIAYNLLESYFERDPRRNKFLIYLLLILIVMGMGTINELIEFNAVIFLGAAQQVGDYLNNAIDLFFNFIGSSFAALFIVHFSKNKPSRYPIIKKRNKK